MLDFVHHQDDSNLPVEYTLTSSLLGAYSADLAKVEQFSSMIEQHRDVVGHFFPEGRIASFNSLENAIKELDASYWSRAMTMTGVYEVMPQKRRDEWNEAIYNRKTPPFERETVLSTLKDLLIKKEQFFAERVDGVFRALSHEHVTNSPMGFRKRMILSYVHSVYGENFYSTNPSTAGYINDLRSVIAKFMGCEAPNLGSAHTLIDVCRGSFGEWVMVDGGSFRIRVYKKGTAHIEIHPDMAWRLNGVLHSLYPYAIPSEFRTEPKRKPKKDFWMMDRPLPMQVLYVIDRGYIQAKEISLPRTEMNSDAFKEACSVMCAIGGVLRKDSLNIFEFDYPPRDVIKHIVATGAIPDYKSYQYYPTPPEVAEYAVSLAEIEPGHKCLEPSAGVGGLADFMPKDTTCVEISELHAEVLQAKGFEVKTMDFLGVTGVFHRIVMNPPFSKGRAKDHVEHALGMLARGGRLVAILPASLRNQWFPDGYQVSWSDVIENAFDKTGISVAIMVADLKEDLI